MKTYVFKVELEQDDNRWVAEIPSLNSVTEGDTRGEALEALKELARAYLEVSLEYGDSLPQPTGARTALPGVAPS